MAEDPLRDFLEPDRAFLIRLISLVIDKGQDHSITLRRAQAGFGPDAHEYWIAFDDGSQPRVPVPLPYNVNVFRPLPPMSFVRPLPGQQERFSFTVKAFDWYREATAPTDQQIQQALARALMTSVHAHPHDYPFQSSNLDDVASRLSISRDRVVQNAYTMIHIGKAQGPQETGTDGVEAGWVSLTPEGIDWVNSGFIDRSVAQVQVDLKVDLTVSIQTLVTQLHQLQIPEEIKDQLQDLLTDFEDDPTLSKFKNVMSFGADVAGLGQVAALISPFLYNFVMANSDYFLHLFKLPSFLFR